MTTNVVPFHELTTEEARTIVREIAEFSTLKEEDDQEERERKEREIRHRLTEAGFRGEAAAISMIKTGLSSRTGIMIHGPRREIISV